MISDIRYWEKKASEGHYAIPHFQCMECRDADGSY